MNAPTPPARRPRRALFAAALLAAFVVACAAAALWWTVSTAAGLQAALAAAARLAPIRLQAIDVQGSLREGFFIGRLSAEGDDWRVDVARLSVEPAGFDARAAKWRLRRLAAEVIDVRLPPPAAPPRDTALPASLAPPLALEIEHLAVGRLALGDTAGGETVRLDALEGALAADADTLRVPRASAQLAGALIELNAELAAQPPFALHAAGRAQSRLAGQALAVDFKLAGRLDAFTLTAQAAAEATGAAARVQVQPFAALPLASADVTLHEVELAQWMVDAPRARLSAQVTLAPVPGAATLTLRGPLEISNATPGPVDRGQLPVARAGGVLIWSAGDARIDDLQVQAAGGRLSGTLRWQAEAGLELTARGGGIDAARIDSRAVRTAIEFDGGFRHAEGTSTLRGRLRNRAQPALAAEVDLALSDGRLTIAPSRLSLDGGRVALEGAVILGPATTANLRAEFRDLDLARLVPRLDTRLTGNVRIDGRLKPALGGSAQFALEPSRILGRPVAGRGRLEVRDDRSADVELDLASGTARLQAAGTAGPQGNIVVAFEAPSLAELAPQWAGRLKAQATVSGTVENLRVRGDLTASDLRLPGDAAVAHVEGAFDIGRASAAPLALTLSARGIAAGDRRLDALGVAATGTTEAHTVRLDAREGDDAYEARLQGGWLGQDWRGALLAVQSPARIGLKVAAPVPLVVGLERQSIGPGDFEARQARFTGVAFERSAGGWTTRGGFDDWRVQRVRGAGATRALLRARGAPPAGLRLRGEWNVAARDGVLDGSVSVTRVSGDLFTGAAARPLGLQTLDATVRIEANQLRGQAQARGDGFGTLRAEFAATVEAADGGRWRLAPQRPLRAVIEGRLDDLAWVGPLVDDDIATAGRATVSIEVGGTPATPAATGTVEADDLRIASVAQALRLEGGRLRARLDDGALVLDELRFAGALRARPANARAAAGLPDDPSGELRVFGRLALHSGTGSFTAEMTRLPLLQEPRRWLVASGTGGIAISPQGTRLQAQITADGAYFDAAALARETTLPGDVIVRRGSPRPEAAAARPRPLVLDVSADLGRHTFVRADGLETRLEGSVTVRGPVEALRATGTVRAVEGTYTGYGQRLDLARGLVTFQGRLDDPALNILAVRRNLPVEVGVAVTGTALKPNVRLFSDPAMSEAEKLSWLVLGRPLEAGTDDARDRAALAAAAVSILGERGGADVAATLRGLGIDEIGVRSPADAGSLLPRTTTAGKLRGGTRTGTDAATEVVAIGKRLTENLYVSFEQALTGTEYMLALSYRLGERWSIVLRAGSTAAVNLVYSVAFD